MNQGCIIVKIGNATAIMCGGEITDHKCNEKDTVYEFSDGFNGSLLAKAKAEKLNLNMCDEDKLHFLREKDIHVNSASVACSICGRATEIDNRHWL